MKNFRIVFMGTPEFAVTTLGSLLMNGFNIVGVVTAPDKPSGRGRKMKKPDVKEFAEFSSLPLMQPTNLKDPVFIENLRDLNADIFIVVAFRMLPEEVWKIPPLGTINLHASLLPHYRGAAPVNHAIINGETVTGVTTFYIDNKIDTGNILLRDEVHISPFENAGDLHDKLMKQGARLIIRTLSDLAGNKITPQPQDNFIKPGMTIKEAPKIMPSDCIINWDNNTIRIFDFIRGLAPHPCARSYIKKGDSILSVKICECNPEVMYHNLTPGTIDTDGKHYIKVACRDGFINVTSLLAEGKRRMNTVEFLRGFPIKEYIITNTPKV